MEMSNGLSPDTKTNKSSSFNGQEFDSFGFPIINQTDSNKKTRITKKKPTNVWRIILISLIIFIVVIGLIMATLAGYHSYTESAGSNFVIRSTRVLLAIIFAPIYLIYVLIKSSFF